MVPRARRSRVTARVLVEPTYQLVGLQKKLVDTVAPFTAKTGTSAAFVNPHVSIGLAPLDVLKKLLEERFEAFTFSPESAAVYQLGNFGTARKKLKGWG